jgi:hypothetical protein
MMSNKRNTIPANKAASLPACCLHPHDAHIVQPLEIYRGRPISYCAANFALGSGNGHAGGLLLGLRLESIVDAYPLCCLHCPERTERINA